MEFVVRISVGVFILLTFSIPVFPSTGGYPNWQCFLAEKNINAFAETDSSYWIGTDGGLVEIEKNSNEKKYHNKANSMTRGNMITALYTDKNGNLWIGAKYCFSSGGWEYQIVTTRKKDGTWKQYKPVLYLDDGQGFKYICEDDNGKILLSNGGNMFTVASDSLIAVSSVGDSINCMFRDRNGRLWVGGNKKLSYRQNNTWFDIPFFQSAKVYCIDQDGNGKLVITSSKGGFQMDGENVFTQLFPDKITSFAVNNTAVWCSGNPFRSFKNNQFTEDSFSVKRVFKDKSSRIWAVTNNDKIIICENHDRTHITIDNDDLRSNNVLSLFTGSDGTVWVGTDSGLQSFDGEKWYTYNFPDTAIARKEVNMIYEDKDRNLWVSKRNQLLRREVSGQWMIEDLSKLSLRTNQVMGMLHASNGELWLWFYHPENIYKKNTGGMWDSITSFKNFNNNNIREDFQGRIWFGSNYYQNNTWVSTANYRVDIVYIHEDGRIWGSGHSMDSVYYLNDKTWEPVCSGKSVRHMIRHSSNAFWITEGYVIAAKIISTDGSIVDSFNYVNSPITNSIECMTVDSSGHTWMGSGDGLLRYHDDTPVVVTNDYNSHHDKRAGCVTVNFMNNTIFFKTDRTRKVKFVLLDLQGRTLGTRIGEFKGGFYQHEMQLSELYKTGLPKGIYILNVNNGNVSKSIKIISAAGICNN